MWATHIDGRHSNRRVGASAMSVSALGCMKPSGVASLVVLILPRLLLKFSAKSFLKNHRISMLIFMPAVADLPWNLKWRICCTHFLLKLLSLISWHVSDLCNCRRRLRTLLSQNVSAVGLQFRRDSEMTFRILLARPGLTAHFISSVA